MKDEKQLKAERNDNYRWLENKKKVDGQMKK